MDKINKSSAVERALRHDRKLVISGLLIVVGLSWAYLLIGAFSMQDLDSILVPASSGPWTFGYSLLMLVMWVVMMAAMMLPSATPMILLYAKIARGRQGEEKHAIRSNCFVLGYIALWTVFSLVAVSLQFGLEIAAMLSPTMQTTNGALAGVVLITAGVYQWTSLKQACLQHCRSPLEFLVTHWRNGLRGAFAMGMQHGAYCLGCCWMLMLLLFIGGVMNLLWIAALTFFVLVEKFAPAGHWIARAAGVLLIGWGIATLLYTVVEH